MSRAGFYRAIASEQQRVLREFRVDFRDGERPEYEVRAEIAQGGARLPLFDERTDTGRPNSEAAVTTHTKRGRSTLIVDISMAQVALISCETAGTIRRLFPNSETMGKVAQAADDLVNARADTLEGLMHAHAIVGAWLSVLRSGSEHRVLSAAPAHLRDAPRQDAVIARLTQLTKILTLPISAAA